VARSRPAPLEVEAKLLVAREGDLRAIARLESIGPYRLLPHGAARLHSVYIDTPDLTLARRRIAVRLRRHLGRWELTAKWAGRVAGLVHERPERTVALCTAPRFPFHLDGQLHGDLEAIVAGCALSPILITDIHRRRFDVSLLAAPATAPPLAELALDRVRLRAPDDRQAVATYCEIEIERLHGTRRHVTRLARLLQQRFDLAPSAESKFSRGLGLLYGAGFHAECGAQ
jgi:triphosphatase